MKTAGQKLKRAWPLLSALGLMATLVSWSFASPVGASPDEDYHLVSIWCASDGIPGMCEQLESPAERKVNLGLIEAACFAQQPTVSANCQQKNGVFEETELVNSSRGNFLGNYPDLFYASLHTFATNDIQQSVVSMRIFNAALFVILVSFLWMLLPTSSRFSLYFTIVLTIVPLGLFLIPSINPSSWAVTGAIVAFFGTTGLLLRRDKLRFLAGALALIGLIMALGSRYDGFVYSVIGIFAAIFLAKQFVIPRKIFWIGLGSVVSLSVLALFFGGTSLIARFAGLAGGTGQSGDNNPLAILGKNIANLPWLWSGFSGGMGIGWLDTVLPYSTWMLAAVLVWGVLFMRLGQISKKGLLAAAGIVTLLTLIPLLVLQSNLAVVGENVQSRYLYPLFLILVSVVLFSSDGESKIFNRVQVMLIVALLMVSQTLAISSNMTRYSTGSAFNFLLRDSGAARQSGWWWEGSLSPLVILLLSILGFMFFLSLSFWAIRLRAITKTSEHESR